MPQDNPYDGSYPLTSYTPTQIVKRLTEFQLDNSDIVAEIYHRLRGEVFSLSEQKWEPELEPYYNKVGVNEIIAWFAPKVDKSVILSDFTPHNVEIQVRKHHQTLALMLVTHIHEWQHPKRKRSLTSVLDFTMTTLMPPIFATYKRAEKGGERKLLVELETRTEKIITDQDSLNKARDAKNKWYQFDLGRRGK